MVSTADVVVWLISGFLAAGVGMSRYAKWKTRHNLLRDLAGMDPDRRAKILSRLNPELALEVRQQLMERFRLS
jgi:flagellar motility protein MotE (MotC chaperone)